MPQAGEKEKYAQSIPLPFSAKIPSQPFVAVPEHNGLLGRISLTMPYSVLFDVRTWVEDDIKESLQSVKGEYVDSSRSKQVSHFFRKWATSVKLKVCEEN